jgi:hypothetical protein
MRAHAGVDPRSGAGASLVCVDPIRVHQVWPHVEALIERAMQRGGVSDFEELEQRVWRGQALLWIVWDGEKILAAVVTAISIANGRKLCTIVACGAPSPSRKRGRVMVGERWLHLLDGIEAYARDEGCAAMVIVGRRGWERVLPQWRRRAVILERSL